MSDERRRVNHEKPHNNQRLFSSSLRSALGGQIPRNNGRRIQKLDAKIQPSYQSIDEALKELGKALEQPSTSLDEFEAYIVTNALKFEEQECREVASKLMEYALASYEFRFLLKIITDNITHMNLMDAVAQEILLATNEYFLSADYEKQTVPELIGHIVGAKWPPGKGKAIEDVNPVLFVTINLVLSWIGIMRSYGEPKSSQPTTPKNEEESSTREVEEYDEKTASLAVISIFSVCNISQRNFWLNFMETFDDVFVVTKQLLINPDAHLPKRVKESLLQLYMSLFKWSSSAQKVKFTSVSTQT